MPKAPPPKPSKPAHTINGISVFLLRGALGPHYMKDWSEEHLREWEEYKEKAKNLWQGLSTPWLFVWVSL